MTSPFADASGFFVVTEALLSFPRLIRIPDNELGDLTLFFAVSIPRIRRKGGAMLHDTLDDLLTDDEKHELEDELTDELDELNPRLELNEAYDEETPLEQTEARAIAEAEFSEPDFLYDKTSDPGVVDEEIVYAELAEKGAGAETTPEDTDDMGFHIEEIGPQDSTFDTRARSRHGKENYDQES